MPKNKKLDTLFENQIQIAIELITQSLDSPDFDSTKFDKFVYRVAEAFGRDKRDLLKGLVSNIKFWNKLLSDVSKHREFIAYILQLTSFYDLPDEIQTKLTQAFGIKFVNFKNEPKSGKMENSIGYSCSDMDLVYSTMTRRRFSLNSLFLKRSNDFNYATAHAYYEVVYYPELEGMIYGKAEGVRAFLCLESFVTSDGSTFIYGINYNVDTDSNIRYYDSINENITQIVYIFEDIFKLLEVLNQVTDVKEAYYILDMIYEKLNSYTNLYQKYPLSKKSLNQLKEKIYKILQTLNIHLGNTDLSKSEISSLRKLSASVDKCLREHLNELLSLIKSQHGVDIKIDYSSKKIIILNPLPDEKWYMSRQIQISDKTVKDEPYPIDNLNIDIGPSSVAKPNKNSNLINLETALKTGLVSMDTLEQ